MIANWNPNLKKKKKKSTSQQNMKEWKVIARMNLKDDDINLCKEKRGKKKENMLHQL